jgi:2-dehydro-3-deoxyphosphooctonate aldolase (KDO 8-P synthase)
MNNQAGQLASQSVQALFKTFFHPHKTSLFFVLGPCVIEDHDAAFETALQLKHITGRLGLPFIFKASYDKANRSSLQSFRGPGIDAGLAVLEAIKSELEIPILSDVHQVSDVAKAAAVLDIIQIPAFLCRQTDLILAVARTGKWMNIKKGQFVAPWDMTNVVAKTRAMNNPHLILTERGACFGYNNLVVDFRAIPIMRDMGVPVVFDATHSVQLPGGQGGCSGGQSEYAPILAQAAVAAGADGIFMEVHPNPANARCDGPNSIRLDELEPILSRLQALWEVLNSAI